MNDIPEKPFDVDWLVYSQELSEWVPNVPFPEDADFVLGYGPQPEKLVVDEFVDESGNLFQRHDIVIPEGSIVYVWNHIELKWIKKPDIPAHVVMPTLQEFSQGIYESGAIEKPA